MKIFLRSLPKNPYRNHGVFAVSDCSFARSALPMNYHPRLLPLELPVPVLSLAAVEASVVAAARMEFHNHAAADREAVPSRTLLQVAEDDRNDGPEDSKKIETFPGVVAGMAEEAEHDIAFEWESNRWLMLHQKLLDAMPDATGNLDVSDEVVDSPKAAVARAAESDAGLAVGLRRQNLKVFEECWTGSNFHKLSLNREQHCSQLSVHPYRELR